MTDYPQWVRERACELAAETQPNAGWSFSPSNVDDRASWQALLAHVLKYETAPVDPDEALAVEAVKQVWPHLNNEIAEEIKDSGFYLAALAAIRLARERNAL